ncbi:3'-5' exonuclease [Hoylesella enoeca]|uniref:DNA polymerase III subunit epsilon n=1 Tax=Hoylesella enoeca TaxID=76123 RepID=A0A0S2KL37_9BACT|nr:3'-5' exonuclease [Hoylesella enoeca]ALO49016.1 DNA polymerase III subunit epsilon [Hoylesella enoeca]
MKDFAAIDFETANGYRTSVCSVGVVIVEDGKIVDTYYHLIRPIPNFYTQWTTQIHGLTRQDTDRQPLFPEVWAEIAPRIKYLPLVAHNKAFDENCLKAVFQAYEMTYSDYPFLCTLMGARRRFRRGELPNYQLQTVALRCGFDLKAHHHALADAEACAHIALRIL